MIKKISGVYKITNTVTGDFYIGSSKNVKHRWENHKCKYTWKQCPNNPMYLDFQRYGLEKFEFQVIEEAEIEALKETEQKFIEMLHPTYNDRNADGLDIERYKEHYKEYYQQNRENKKEYYKEYYQQNRENKKEYCKEYCQQNREKRKEYQNKYNNQLCRYNGEVLTLNTLRMRFYRAGIKNPTLEAKKYIDQPQS